MPGRPASHRLDPVAAAVLRHVERWRGLTVAPLLLAYRASDQRALIDADARRWSEILNLDGGGALNRSLLGMPEFRGVFYHRLRHGNPTGVLLGAVFQRLWKTVPGLDLGSTPIGAGLFVSHGQGTILSAERIGVDAYVQQDVTVGWDYLTERLPIIGDGVFIGAGAKILGARTIGDGARIGANAVVLCDVPAGATAVGVPARIVRAGSEEEASVARLCLTSWDAADTG